MRSGFVSLIGRPNVGKSTLLNTLINQKIAITSNKPQTTRNIIQGIYNEEGYQIVFVDTPGIHKPLNKLGKVLNKEAQSLTKDVDAVLLIVDAKDGIGTGDKKIIESLRGTDSPVILVLNKIDKMTDNEIIQAITDYKDLYDFAEIVPISALQNNNVATLLNVIKKYLTDNMRYFDEDMITSSSLNFMVSEFVREKIFRMTEEEIPHSITCITSKYEEKKDGEKHAIIAARRFINDKTMVTFFNDEERQVIKEAIEDHSSSLAEPPRSKYGELVSSADRNTRIEIVFIRSFFVGKTRTPDMDIEEYLDFTFKRLSKRYGEENPENMFLEDETYRVFLKDMRTLLQNETDLQN